MAGAGWKVEFDAKSIADKIVEVVNNLRTNYTLYHDAAYSLSSNYDWEKIAKQHIDLMMQISNEQNCKKI